MNNMIKTVDLHTHSTFSDGTFSPAELVKKAVEKNLAAFALTDHDAVGGIESAITAIKEQNASVLFVPGTELSVGYKDGDIHIVGLFIDYKNPAFTKISDLLVSRRVDRNKEMVAKFNNASINMTYEELKSLANVIVPLIKAGQSPYQVLTNHPELNISKKTLYNYIEDGVFREFGLLDIDLR